MYLSYFMYMTRVLLSPLCVWAMLHRVQYTFLSVSQNPELKNLSEIMSHVSRLDLTIGITFWFKFCFNLPWSVPTSASLMELSLLIK